VQIWQSIRRLPWIRAGGLRLWRAVGGMLRRRQESPRAAGDAAMAGFASEARRRYARIETAMNSVAQGIVIFDEQRRVVFCNERYREMFGLTEAQVRPGSSVAGLIEHRLKLGRNIAQDREAYIRERMTGPVKPDNAIHHYADGRVIAYSVRPLPGGGGIAMHEDVTERERLHATLRVKNKRLREQEDRLRLRNMLFDAALNTMSEGLSMFDTEHRLLVCNESYKRLYRIPPELCVPGTPLKEILEHRMGKDGVSAGQDEATTREIMAFAFQKNSGTKIWDLRDGRSILIKREQIPEGGWVATHEDITEQRRASMRLAHMAHHDALTGLPNRAMLREELTAALARCGEQAPVAALCLDLDHFKEVNDTLGHSAGDELLKQVARRLRGCVRQNDIVARMGGDEFAILQTGGSQPADSILLASRIVNAVKEPYEVEGQQVVTAASIGIAFAPAHGADPDQVLRSADLALYAAKSSGRSAYAVFEPRMSERVHARRQLGLDLRRAIQDGEFVLYYQPFLDVNTNEVVGAEALLRWRHPERGMVSPAEFVPLAEETGLIVPIGEWALRRACVEAASWPSHIKVAVNLSAVQFRSSGLVPSIVSALSASGLPPQRLELEITETVLLQDTEAVFATLHQIRGLGVAISLDDFGTGYSSLSYLQCFPFDKIKVDRSFIQGLGQTHGRSSLAILRAVAYLGFSLGMITIAEGVETEEQLAEVRTEGFHQAQGYLVSTPKPAEEFARHFARRPSAA